MNERFLFRSFLLSFGIVLGFQLTVSGLGVESPRLWTSDDGRELEATFVRFEAESVILELTSGREARVPLEGLSEEDRKWVLSLPHQETQFRPNPLPEETRLEGDIEVTGGPELYFTPHFSFQTEEEVSAAFISEAAKIYEGSYLALNSLPHGLTFSPPEGSDHFRGTFLNERRFDAIAREKLVTIPGQRVVGLYLGDEKRLLVPYSSLGAERLGSRLTLRKRSDTSTLVHEIVHQVMHEYLPVLPTWFSEGMAEYLSAIPYQNGRFEFRNAERGLKERLENEYQSERTRVTGVKRPSLYFSEAPDLANRDSSRSNQSRAGRAAAPRTSISSSWGGTVQEYRDSLLMVYFFMHLDQPEEAGKPVGEYLHLADKAMGEADLILEMIAGYEAERLAYNERVQTFNQSLDDYQTAAASYNKKVEQYNEEVRNGVPEADRVDVGEPPAEPVRPEGLELPDALRDLAGESERVDLVVMIQERARGALLRGRNPLELDQRMKEAFAGFGIEINYSL